MNAKELMDGGKHHGWDDNRPNRWRTRNIEDSPKFESSKTRNGKGFNPNIRPLERFLDKNVGKPWDAVYSHLCSMADSRSHAGYMLREMIGWLVDKKIYNRYWHRGYVVDEKGVLRKVERQRYEPAPTPKYVLKVDDRFFAKFYNRRKNAFWFELVLAPFPPKQRYTTKNADGTFTVNEYEPCINDCAFGRIPSDSYGSYYKRNRESEKIRLTRFYGKPCYAKAKRQLSTDEIQKFVGNRDAEFTPIGKG